jgi:hypothetical protein
VSAVRPSAFRLNVAAAEALPPRKNLRHAVLRTEPNFNGYYTNCSISCLRHNCLQIRVSQQASMRSKSKRGCSPTNSEAVPQSVNVTRQTFPFRSTRPHLRDVIRQISLLPDKKLNNSGITEARCNKYRRIEESQVQFLLLLLLLPIDFIYRLDFVFILLFFLLDHRPLLVYSSTRIYIDTLSTASRPYHPNIRDHGKNNNPLRPPRPRLPQPQ